MLHCSSFTVLALQARLDRLARDAESTWRRKGFRHCVPITILCVNTAHGWLWWWRALGRFSSLPANAWLEDVVNKIRSHWGGRSALDIFFSSLVDSGKMKRFLQNKKGRSSLRQNQKSGPRYAPKDFCKFILMFLIACEDTREYDFLIKCPYSSC